MNTTPFEPESAQPVPLLFVDLNNSNYFASELVTLLRQLKYDSDNMPHNGEISHDMIRAQLDVLLMALSRQSHIIMDLQEQLDLPNLDFRHSIGVFEPRKFEDAAPEEKQN